MSVTYASEIKQGKNYFLIKVRHFCRKFSIKTRIGCYCLGARNYLETFTKANNILIYIIPLVRNNIKR